MLAYIYFSNSYYINFHLINSKKGATWKAKEGFGQAGIWTCLNKWCHVEG